MITNLVKMKYPSYLNGYEKNVSDMDHMPQCVEVIWTPGLDVLKWNGSQASMCWSAVDQNPQCVEVKWITGLNVLK